MDKQMIKVILRLSCGVGMDSADSFLVSEENWARHQDWTTHHGMDYLGEYAWEAAVDFAISYGIYPMSDMPEGYDEDEADWRDDAYSEDIEGWFELYDPEEHDGLKVCGGDWDWREI